MDKKIFGRFLKLVLGGAAALSLLGCSLPFGASSGGGQAVPVVTGSTAQAAAEILEEAPLVPPAGEDGRYHIGVLTYQDHGAARETVRGFEEELSSLLGGDKAVFEEMDAGGDAGKCAEIATAFSNSGYKLIFAVGTEAVQNAGAAVKDIPIIGGCVTDYLIAGLVSSVEAPGGNITGVSSLGPIEEQLALCRQFLPWGGTVGILTSGTETGSRFQARVAAQCLTEAGIAWTAYQGPTEEGLLQEMEEAARDCSVIYLPTDNFVASHMDIVRDVMVRTGVPVVTGDYQMCSAGGLCTVSIDYTEHGKRAAQMAYGILARGEEITRMGVQEEESWDWYYNPAAADCIEWYGYGNMQPLDVDGADYEAARQKEES